MSIIVIFLNSTFTSNIIAPSFVRSSECVLRDDLVSAERVSELLPLKATQVHQQLLCKQTNMFSTSFYTTNLRKYWLEDGINRSVGISYYSDENGMQTFYIPIDPFFYLLSPLIFAFFLSRNGQTFGKRILGLVVYNDALEKPAFKAALKREYFKGIFFVLVAMIGFYGIYQAYNFDIEQAAKSVEELYETTQLRNPLLWIIGSIAFSIMILWFHFGSFIRWTGRTYWDKFARLNSNMINELNMEKDIQKL